MNYPIEITDLTKTFPGVEAIAGVTMTVPEGSVFALVGSNGAGKTTLVKTLLNIHRPTSGRADILGANSTKLDADRMAQIGYVSENQRLPGWMKTGYFFSYCKEFYTAWDDGELNELVRLYELPLDRRLSALSRGMRVKAALASSLAYRPRLIVLDEPFSGLDVLVREQVIESILDRVPETTVFIASHDLSEIESFATHIAYLSEGRLDFVEEMARLCDRFREIEITFDNPVELPSDLPSSWLNPGRSSVVVRFTDSDFNEERSRAEIRHRFSGVREVTSRVLTLREMILALARSAKVKRGER